MSTATDGERRAEEAGTDEVAALAAMLAVPARPHHDELDDEDETFPVVRHEHDVVTAALPRQRDEFTCPLCFLVVHRSRRVGDVCRDCS